MNHPYTLVPDSISHDTVRALEELLELAIAGEVIGLGFVALYKRRRFITNTAGACHSDPTLTRGMLLSLDDELRGQIQERKFDDTHL